MAVMTHVNFHEGEKTFILDEIASDEAQKICLSVCRTSILYLYSGTPKIAWCRWLKVQHCRWQITKIREKLTTKNVLIAIFAMSRMYYSLLTIKWSLK